MKKDQKIENKEHVGLTLKVFKDVPDKVARGVAKKAFQYTKRNNMSYIEMADYINSAVNSASKSTDQMSEAILKIRDYVDPIIESSDDMHKEVDQNNLATPMVDPTSTEEQSSNSNFSTISRSSIFWEFYKF